MSIAVSVKTQNSQFKLTGLSSKTTYGELTSMIAKQASMTEGTFEVLIGFPPKLLSATSSSTFESLNIKNGEGLIVRTKGNTGIMKGEGGFVGLSNIFGDSLIAHGGKKVSTQTALTGSKRIGIYFSAHWCPPCKQFTPYLAKVYASMKKDGLPFEVIFVSSDRDEHAFNEYFESMPWLAIPFQNRQLAQTLGEKYEIEGIPTLVILDGTGKLISMDGREMVSEDATGKLLMQ